MVFEKRVARDMKRADEVAEASAWLGRPPGCRLWLGVAYLGLQRLEIQRDPTASEEDAGDWETCVLVPVPWVRLRLGVQGSANNEELDRPDFEQETLALPSKELSWASGTRRMSRPSSSSIRLLPFKDGAGHCFGNLRSLAGDRQPSWGLPHLRHRALPSWRALGNDCMRPGARTSTSTIRHCSRRSEWTLQSSSLSVARTTRRRHPKEGSWK